MKNKNFVFSGFLSISIHVIFLFVPIKSVVMGNIDIDVIKAPASIELSIIEHAASVEVKAEKIEKVDFDKEALKTEGSEKERNNITPQESIGAISEQISTYMTNKPPAYPTLARLKGWEGEVVLTANVSSEGLVINVAIFSTSGFYILDQTAKNAIEKWRFRNITQPAEIKIPVKFVLTSR